MSLSDRAIRRGLELRGISRRDFLRFCATVTATLSLPASEVEVVAQALENQERLPIVFLHGQECSGDDESLLRVTNPGIEDVLFDLISLDYFSTIMADAGAQAEQHLLDTVSRYSGRYVVIQEGSIPTGENAIYSTVGGRTSEDWLRLAARDCAAVICVGACASWGGWPASRPNPTGAGPASAIVKDKPIVNLTGCPHNGYNAIATIVHFLTYGRLPELDSRGRPLFAHGKRIHDNCERRAHFDAGQFVQSWGDEGHRQGWCLYEMGCKGPQAYYNCPTLRWNDRTSWPVQSGHGCIACASFDFWDEMTPFYARLPGVTNLPVEGTVDALGIAALALTLGGIAAHAVGTSIWKARRDRIRPGEPVTTGGVQPGPAPEAGEPPPAEPPTDMPDRPREV